MTDSSKNLTPNRGDDEQGTSSELLSQVARLYYLDGKTQKQIGEELGFSRQKVQRLLQRARELRIVEIHVHSVPFLHTELENRFKEHFPLKEMVIAPAHPDEQYRRVSVARAAGAYLERVLSPGMIVAVDLGRNASQVASYFRPTRPIDCTFVSAIGGASLAGSEIDPDQICATFAARADAKTVRLNAPTFVENSQARNALFEQEGIKEALELARSSRMRLVTASWKARVDPGQDRRSVRGRGPPAARDGGGGRGAGQLLRPGGEPPQVRPGGTPGRSYHTGAA